MAAESKKRNLKTERVIVQMHIRNSAKAVILKGSKLLLTRNIDDEGNFYLFPGGGQYYGETLTDAVKRECMEEVGAHVEVQDLLHIREYIGKNHEHSNFDSGIHQVEYYFFCKLLTEEEEFEIPLNPDSHQTGIEWVDVNDLLGLRLYPKAIIPAMADRIEERKGKIYLGDVN